MSSRNEPGSSRNYMVSAMRVIIATVGALATLSVPAGAAEFKVTSPADAVDASVGDGHVRRAPPRAAACTLRAAVQEANAAGGASTISVPAGRYRLTIPPSPQAGSAADMDAGNGDLDLNARHHDPRCRRRRDDRRRRRHRPRLRDRRPRPRSRLSDLTITGGDSTAGGSQEIDLGGGILNKSEITLDRVELVGNKADGGGGMFSIPATSPIDPRQPDRGQPRVRGRRAAHRHRRRRSSTRRSPATRCGRCRPTDLANKPVGDRDPDGRRDLGLRRRHRPPRRQPLTIVNSTITDNHAAQGRRRHRRRAGLRAGLRAARRSAASRCATRSSPATPATPGRANCRDQPGQSSRSGTTSTPTAAAS